MLAPRLIGLVIPLGLDTFAVSAAIGMTGGEGRPTRRRGIRGYALPPGDARSPSERPVRCSARLAPRLSEGAAGRRRASLPATVQLSATRPEGARYACSRHYGHHR
jgi:hypothetical protein